MKPGFDYTGHIPSVETSLQVGPSLKMIPFGSIFVCLKPDTHVGHLVASEKNAMAKAIAAKARHTQLLSAAVILTDPEGASPRPSTHPIYG